MHVIVTKNGLKYIFLIKKNVSRFKGKRWAGWSIIFAFNIALFSCIFVLIQFVLEFRFVSQVVDSHPNNRQIGFGDKHTPNQHHNQPTVKFPPLNVHNLTRFKLDFRLQTSKQSYI